MTAVAGIVQPTLEKGDHLVICGDSITFHSVALPFGFHHQLTNVFAKTCPEKGLTVSSLGFSGYQVGSWIDLDRKSRTQKVWTHFKHPGWNVSDVLSNKVDAVAVFLGMNDILMPSMDGSEKSVDAWGARLKRLVRALREHTGAKKFVLCTTTPLTADPASPKNVVRLEMGERLRAVAAEEGCGVADFGRAVMDVIDDCRRVSNAFQPVPDFVHPQKLGHLAMARELCRAFGETAAAEVLSRDFDAELASVSRASEENVVWRLHPLTRDGSSRELSYRIEWFWHDTEKVRAGDNPVRATFDVPAGWTVVSRKDDARAGEVVVKGVPDRLSNLVSIALTAGSVSRSATIGIPTPWRVSSGWDCRETWFGTTWQTNALKRAEEDRAAADAALKGPWSYVTGTRDYTGGGASGSLDPYQVTFGTTVDSLWAVRYVVSEKDREVEGLLSHLTFSISAGFTLYVNGEKVFADFLDRNGKRKSRVPAFRLRKGLNEIRLRVDHNSWQRQFSFDLVQVAGDDLSGLRFVTGDVSADAVARPAVSFMAAEPVWPRGRAEVLNDSALFGCTFDSDGRTRPVLRLTGASDYRVKLNGEFVGWGPARAARFLFRVDELALAARKGRNELTIEVSSWNANTYVLPMHPGFLQAEVVADGRVLAATGVTGGFTARETGRVRETVRYSFQRGFSESYCLTDVSAEPLPLERRPDVKLLPREIPQPDFSLSEAMRPLSATQVTDDPSVPVPSVRFVNGGPNGFRFYPTNALAVNAWASLRRHRVTRTAARADGRLGGGDGILYDLGRVEAGFPHVSVACAKPTRVWVTFSETLQEGVASPLRFDGNGIVNGVLWELPAGEHELEAFEPYSLRYLHVYALDGEARLISAPRLRRCRNAAMAQVRFASSDPELDAVFAASVASLAPNAVDGLTDCPSRERACWQCDSYFLAQGCQMLGGSRALERFHLMNFADAQDVELGLTAEKFPSCYPADHLDGLQIGNWPWWFVIQLEDYGGFVHKCGSV